MLKSNNKILKIFSLIFIVSLLSGCGIWTNFKTYFNTYYNAKVLFEEAEEKLLLERNELFYFEEKPISKNISDNFNKVIEKTSAILQYSKESDFVEEALLLTGKSFYYQQNYSRALRKFNELIAITDSDLALENKLWIGKTKLQMREFETALRILEEVKKEAFENDEEEIQIEGYRSIIGYLIYSKDYDLATAEMNDFFETDIDNELKAEVLFEMGNLYKLNDDFESAEKAFAQVENYSPSFDVDFNSKFEVAKLKGELGHVDESLVLLNNLRDQDKFIDNWGDIDLEVGKIYYDRNEIEQALDKFTEVDTTYKKTESASIAGFYRGEILENHFHDYDSALTFYKSAASSTAPPEIRNVAQKKSRLLNQYIVFHNKLEDLQTQFMYVTDENVFRNDSLDYIERVKIDSIKFSENSANTQSKSQSSQFIPKYKQPVRPSISADSILALKSKNHFELANLLFSEFDDPDSAYYYYDLSLKEQPENPNEAQTYFAMGNYFLVKKNKPKADSMFTIVYDKFQFDPIRNEAAKQIGKPLYDFDKDPVEEEYALVENIYNAKKYSKAITGLFDIYENYPNSIYASKSLYTIGYILENELDNPDSAVSIYNILQDKYRTSEYAKAIQVKLTGYKQEQIKIQTKLKAKQDSINTVNSKKDEVLENEIENLDDKSPNIDLEKTTIPKEIDSGTNKKRIDEINETGKKDEVLENEIENLDDKSPNIDLEKTTIPKEIDSETDKKRIDEINETGEKLESEIDGTDEKIIDEIDGTEKKINKDIDLEQNINGKSPTLENNVTNKKETSQVSEQTKSNNFDDHKLVSRDIYKDNDGYYVQVSSWKSKEIAETEVTKLKEKQYNAFIDETYIENLKSNYYKVKLGPFESFQAAKNIREKLNNY